MTLPINYKLPELNKDQSPEQTTSYLQDLTYELQNMYEKTAQNVNGVFRNSLDVDGSEYIPTLAGSTNAGSYTYNRQGSYVLRQGLMTDVWFDVGWTASGGASGQLRLNLPYRQAKQGQIFFVGTCFMNQAPFPVGATQAVILGVTGTFQASFQAFGSGTDTSAISAYSGRGRVGGHLRYIGVEDE